ncbi:MAG: hypothetical protein HY553_12975 [Elusimicrobia bacterium]|nr:hypothetical protein [Elusimicrobiota bacterium]
MRALLVATLLTQLACSWKQVARAPRPQPAPPPAARTPAGPPARAAADAATATDVRVLETHDLSPFESGERGAGPAVDLAVHVASGCSLPWERLSAGVVGAQRIFRAAGVRLRVVGAWTISLPEDWIDLDADRFTGPLQDPLAARKRELYDYIALTKSALTSKAERVFGAVVAGDPPGERRLHLLCLRQVRFTIHEEAPGREPPWKEQLVAAGGLSFPPYKYGDRLPRTLRGIVTLSPTPRTRDPERAIAHELGHKLLNVSHEGTGICPQHEVKGERDLMVYGSGTEIPSGREGRWHRERLHRSPFLYRIDGGTRVYNAEYLAGGEYGDPIYGDYKVLPSCP